MSELEDLPELDTGLATNNAGMFGESDEDEDLLPVRAPQHQEEEEDEEDALIDSSAVALGSAAASKHQEVEEQDLEDSPEDSQAEVEQAAEREQGGKKRRIKQGGEERGSLKSRKASSDKESRRGGDQRRRGSAEDAAPSGRASHASGLEGEDDMDSQEIEETDKDRGFIDDAGASRHAVSDDDEDLEPRPPPEEAEEGEPEENEVDKAVKAAKRKKVKFSEEQLQVEVDDLMGRMEGAAEGDYELMARNSGVELVKEGGNFVKDGQGQFVVARRGPRLARTVPALDKFKMVAEVELFLSQRKYHDRFLASGGLGVLKSWLEPYMDATLPNAKVRGLVLKCCHLLPIDTKRDEIKDNLKKSCLAKRIIFLTKCEDETPANKKLARELVQEWASNIFFDADIEAEKRRSKGDAQLAARALALERNKDTASPSDAPKRHARVGEPGYRVHAAIPQASKLDYLVNPESRGDLKEATGTARKPSDGMVMKKMREVQRKHKFSTQRAMEPSVAGRDIIHYN